MILNISFRTDIVAQYADWLADTLLNKEYIGSRNPYNNKVQLFPTKDIEGIVFCSKNYQHLLPYIGRIHTKYHCQYHYTITPYGKDVEPGIPSDIDSWQCLERLNQIVGSDKITWRYDPILLYGDYTKESHYEWFNNACEKYSKLFKMCTFNFVNIYEKVKKAFPELSAISEADRDEIATEFGKIALRHDVYLQTCILHKDYLGVHNEGCITPKTIGLDIKPAKASLQNGCMCSVHTYGIGNYNTCKGGCKYCYATSYIDNTPNIFDSFLPNGTISESDEIAIISKRVVKETAPSLFDFME